MWLLSKYGCHGAAPMKPMVFAKYNIKYDIVKRIIQITFQEAKSSRQRTQKPATSNVSCGIMLAIKFISYVAPCNVSMYRYEYIFYTLGSRLHFFGNISPGFIV